MKTENVTLASMSDDLPAHAIELRLGVERGRLSINLFQNGEQVPAHVFLENSDGNVILFIWDGPLKDDGLHSRPYSHRIELTRLCYTATQKELPSPCGCRSFAPHVE